MRISRKKLQRIIKEEYNKILREMSHGHDSKMHMQDMEMAVKDAGITGEALIVMGDDIYYYSNLTGLEHAGKTTTHMENDEDPNVSVGTFNLPVYKYDYSRGSLSSGTDFVDFDPDEPAYGHSDSPGFGDAEFMDVPPARRPVDIQMDISDPYEMGRPLSDKGIDDFREEDHSENPYHKAAMASKAEKPRGRG